VTPRKIHKKRSRKQQPKPQRAHVTLLAVLLVGAALLSLGVELAHRIMQMPKRLEAAQSKLHRVSEEAIQTKAREAESRKAALNLRKHLEAARRTSHRAEADAAAVKKQVADLKFELAQMQLRLKAVQSDLEASKDAAAKAKTKAIELGEQTIQLQSELKLGKAERDALRKKLNQAQVSLEAKLPLSKRGYTRLNSDSKARDYLIRTIVFEGEGETELAKAALVHVILNRQKVGKWGDKIKDVVMRPWQFEPWMTRRDEIEKLSSKDPRYQNAAEIVDSVLSGRIPDPTAGATYFLNPVIVRQRRGGSLPVWADGEGRPIGRHVFYSPDDVPLRAGSRRPQPVKVQYGPSGSIGAG
jgi:spore germination cell wall hydrolase CwlJ-like protein